MALHIVIDARRIRDFGIGTYIRSLVHALAPSIAKNHYTLVSAPARRAHAGRPAAELRHPRSTRAGTRDLLDHVAFPLFLRGLRAGPGAHPPEPRAAADAAALRGDHPRHGQPAFPEDELRLPHAVPALPLPARPGAGRRASSRSPTPPSATWRTCWACRRNRIRQSLQRARSRASCADAHATGAGRAGGASWSATRSTTRSCCTPATSGRTRTCRAWWRPSPCCAGNSPPTRSTRTCGWSSSATPFRSIRRCARR